MKPTPAHVSTGALPPRQRVAELVLEAYETARRASGGELSGVYPALADASPEAFGISVVGVTGDVVEAGDAEVEFTIMSVAKPFVFALVCDRIGPGELRELVGVNATGLPFNALDPIDRGAGRTNPMVNPGAIATTSLVPGGSHEERWEFIVAGLSAFAGRSLALDDDVYRSACASNDVNRRIVAALERHGSIAGDPAEGLDLYTRQSSLAVTAHDLATMAATLADGGVNPLTRERVIDAETCRHTLAVMTTAGLYETSGDWLYDVGLPAKSGIGGGIVTVAPGKGGLGTYSPLLDAAGNSVRGQLAAQFLSRALGLDLFASTPAVPAGIRA